MCSVGGVYIGAAAVGNGMEVPQITNRNYNMMHQFYFWYFS